MHQTTHPDFQSLGLALGLVGIALPVIKDFREKCASLQNRRIIAEIEGIPHTPMRSNFTFPSSRENRIAFIGELQHFDIDKLGIRARRVIQ